MTNSGFLDLLFGDDPEPDYVPICHGAPYSGRKHEPVRMAPVENRDWFRCGECGSRASVGVGYE